MADVRAQLEETLRLLHDGSTPPDVRRKAHDQCEAWKETGDAASIVSTVGPLIGAGNSVVVRHFGLHTIEYLLQWRFSSTPHETREVCIVPLFIFHSMAWDVSSPLNLSIFCGRF